MTEPKNNNNKSIVNKFIIKKNTWYELTFVPSDRYQCTGKINRHKNCFNYVHEAFLPIKSMHCLYAELSTPQFGDKHVTTMSRIHWHGVIMFERSRDITDFYLNYYHRLTAIGRIQFNEFRPNHWLDYMCKHRNYFAHLKIDIENITLENIKTIIKTVL